LHLGDSERRGGDAEHDASNGDEATLMNAPDTVPKGDAGRLAWFPVSLFGSVMASAGLALAWRLASAEFGAPAWVGEAFGLLAAAAFVVLSACYAIKCVASFPAVRAEFAHPVAVNFFGTPIIALLLLAPVAMPYSALLGKVLWAAGTASMLGFAWLVVSRWINLRQQVAHATPAWMIPVVGTLNIAIAGATLELPFAPALSVAGLAIGIFFAVPLFTLILSRLVFVEAMPSSAQPSLMILVATFAVCFSSYLAVADRLDLFARSLFSVAVFMFAVLLPRLLRLRGSMPFHVSWWAVTFPLAALTNAALRYAAREPSMPIRAFALLVLAFATLVVLSQGARTLVAVARGELRNLTA
jgi:tellurite resistance protein